MIRKLVTLAFVAASAFAAAPAAAGSPAADAAGWQMIHYGDLNLASASGARILDGRIKAAALRLCGGEQAPGLVESTSVRSCRAEVFATSRSQIGQAFARSDTGSVALAASR